MQISESACALADTVANFLNAFCHHALINNAAKVVANFLLLFISLPVANALNYALLDNVNAKR